MRRVLWACLQAGQLSRRYWLYPACRLGHLEAWRRGPYAKDPMAALSTQPRNLHYRGLLASWVLQSTGPVLLDTPHTKSYRLLFDARLHKLKGLRALRLFTQRPLSRITRVEGLSPACIIKGYVTAPFLIEVGGWGESTPHVPQYWLHCMRVMRRYASVQRQALKACSIVWASLSYAWAVSREVPETGLANGVWAGLLADVDGALGTWLDGGVDFESYDFIPATVAGILAAFNLPWLSPLNAPQFPVWGGRAETPFFHPQWHLEAELVERPYRRTCRLGSVNVATLALYNTVLCHGWLFVSLRF